VQKTVADIRLVDVARLWIGYVERLIWRTAKRIRDKIASQRKYVVHQITPKLLHVFALFLASRKPAPCFKEIIGRDDSTASVDNPVFAILGMAGGVSADYGGSSTYLNHGVYGYAPSENGVGIRGDGGHWGVVGSSAGSAGVVGGGGSAGGIFAGNDYGVIGLGDPGGVGVSGNSALGVWGVGDDSGVLGQVGLDIKGTLATILDRGQKGGVADPVPESNNSEIGVMGEAETYAVAGFNRTGMSGTRRTYGVLGANNLVPTPTMLSD